ncbi:MAG TPA: sigma-70 family RNA polymerase sigma factor [Anaerolineaceae bacterium]|nr:sigma-70 family RNA polymerase sigma factor [Anaerolineaceae bacterium]
MLNPTTAPKSSGEAKGSAPAEEEAADDRLVQAALRSPAQFAVLYRRYVERVYRYFYGRTGSTQDAQDLTTQLFLDVLAALPRYRPQGTFAAWLFTLACRRAADYHRARRVDLPLDWVEESQAGDGDPLGEVIRREQGGRLAELFNRLDEERQELLRLRYAAGLTHRQVGQVLGKSEAAVAMTLHRTLQWFQQNWEDRNE